MKRRSTPRTLVGDLDAATAQRVVAAASDVALLLDPHGVIQDVVVGRDDLDLTLVADWVGQPWAETVTVESRAKVEALLKDAAGPPRWRQINHPQPSGSDWPVLYSTVQISPPGRGKSAGRTIAFGRDLREMSRSATIAGTQFPGEIMPPADGDIVIHWESKTAVAIYVQVQPYDCPKKITINILLDLNLSNEE